MKMEKQELDFLEDQSGERLGFCEEFVDRNKIQPYLWIDIPVAMDFFLKCFILTVSVLRTRQYSSIVDTDRRDKKQPDSKRQKQKS